MIRYYYIIILSLSVSCGQGQIANTKDPLTVIFETDIGNDIDDALALDMLYKYADAGMVEIAAIMNNKDSRYSAEFIDIMNTWYGYPTIPIGDLTDGVTIDDYVNYAQNVCMLERDDRPMFRRTLAGYDDLPKAHILHRKVLAGLPDNSVTIISVGFSTNLARLLETGPDEYSPLTGRELVERKVVLLSVMGGSFGEKPRAEFNIVNDIPAAQKLFELWPGMIVVSPFELGSMIRYPAEVITDHFDWGVDHPMVEGYKHYRPMPYDRQCWDLTSVLYAVEPGNGLMDLSPSGTLRVDDKGYTHFTPSPEGKHFLLSTDSVRAQLIKERFIDLTTTKPANLAAD